MPLEQNTAAAEPSAHHASAEPAAATAPSPEIPGDALLWQELLTATDLGVFCRSWLELQCDWLGDTEAGVVVARRSPGEPFETLAETSAGAGALLGGIVERSLRDQNGLAEILDAEPGCYSVSHVLSAAGIPRAVIAITVKRRDSDALALVLRQIQWGSAWLDARLIAAHSSQSDGNAGSADRQTQLLDLIAIALSAANFDEAAQAVVATLSSLLGCDRVSLGVESGGRTRVVAISHSADFGKQMSLLTSIEAAMDEARDQGVTLQLPDAPDSTPRMTGQHKRLLREHGADSVLTVRLPEVNGTGGGALTFEHSEVDAFGQGRVELCESAGAVLSPLLALRRRDDRSLPSKALASARQQAERLFGAGYLGRKLCGAAVLLLASFFLVAEGEYRVSAEGQLEGESRRAIVAPFDGYVAESMHRAGDFVAEGEVLASLDARDLQLERLKWSSRQIQLRRQLDGARADRERAQVSILSAQIEESDAELARIEERISRTQIVSPLEGLVVSGDLQQSLGGAISRGELLFEIAPLERYRVILRVDEAQIAELRVDQAGIMLLTALPEEPIDFRVSKITPVAATEEGLNFFRVEAELLEISPRLRPGMEGVGKVEIGSRKLFWIWTRGLQTWLRLFVWSWWP